MKKGLIIFVIAFVGALIGYSTGHPIGAFIGSLVSVALIQMKTKKFPPMSLKIKRTIQAVIGGSIGLSFTSETISTLKLIWVPMIIIPVVQLLCSFLLAIILHRFLKLDLATSFCSTNPAGMSEIAIVAEEHGADMPIVATFHLFRILFIISLLPLLIGFI